MTDFPFADSLIDFLNDSPVNFLAAKTITGMLDDAGFSRLDPSDPWELLPGGKHYVVKTVRPCLPLWWAPEALLRGSRSYRPTAIRPVSASSPMPRC